MATRKTAAVDDWQDVPQSASAVNDWQDVSDWQDAPVTAATDNTNPKQGEKTAYGGVNLVRKGKEWVPEQKSAWEKTKDFASGVGDVAKGTYDFGGRFLEAAANPVKAVQLGTDLVKSQVDQGRKAKQAWQRGRTSEAVGHGLAAVTPMVGPPAAEAAETIGDETGKNAWRGVGQAAGMLAPVGVKEAAPRVAPYVRKAAKAVQSPAVANPEVAMAKVYKPTPSDSGFTEGLRQAMEDIKEYGGDVSNNESVIQSSKAAIKSHKAVFEEWMKAARDRNVIVDGDPIFKATGDTAYRGSFKVDQLKAKLSKLNAQLDAFYDKSEGKQIADVVGGKTLAEVKAEADAVRSTLYKALDPTNDGAGPRAVQARTGKIIDLLDAANRRKNAILAEKPVSTFDAVKAAASRAVSIPGKIATGKVEGAFGGVVDAFTGTSDPLIARAFKGVGKAKPLPRPPAGMEAPPPPGFLGFDPAMDNPSVGAPPAYPWPVKPDPRFGSGPELPSNSPPSYPWPQRVDPRFGSGPDLPPGPASPPEAWPRSNDPRFGVRWPPKNYRK